MGIGAGAVFTYLVLVTIVFLVPAAAGLCVALWAGIAARTAQAVCALAGPCLVGYVTAGFYVLSPAAGHVAGVVAYVLAVAAGALAAWRCGAGKVRAGLRFWAAPSLMAPAAAAVSLGIGFLYGGGNLPLELEQVRYFKRVANDNVLPRAFALQLEAAARPLPHYLTGAWLSSDRPPMETSVYLMVRSIVPIGDPHKLVYQVLGTLLQSLWMPALWCVLTVVGLSRWAVAGGLAGVAVSGFVLFNSLYVWPKLLPAAFVVLLAGLLLTDEWRVARRRAAGGAVCGLAAGLAMLGHEGSALALIPLALVVLAVPRRWPRRRWLAPAVGVLVLLMAPWVLYQRYVDPPGTSLTKAQLAGNISPGRSVVSAIADAYEHVSPGKYWRGKLDDLSHVAGSEPQELHSLASLASNLFASQGRGAAARLAAVEELRHLSYADFLPALGLLVLGPVAWALAAWLRRQRGPDMAFAGRVWVFLLVAIPLWAFILFLPGATTNEQGSYGFELLAFGAALIGLWRLSRVLAGVVMTLQVAIGLVVAATVETPYHGSVRLPGGRDVGEIVLAAGGLLLVVLLPLLAPRLAVPETGEPAVEPAGEPPADPTPVLPALVGS